MKYNNNKCDKTREKRRRRKEQAKIHLTMKEKDRKISSRLILLKYAKEKNQEDEWLSNREWNLYPPEEEKRVTFARMLSFKDENIPCALIKVGGGKVRLIHTVVFAPMKKFYAFDACDPCGWNFQKGEKSKSGPVDVLELDIDFFESEKILFDHNFKKNKMEFEEYMGLEFTTYRESFDYTIGSYQKGPRRTKDFPNNNGPTPDMSHLEYERRFNGIGPRLKRCHFWEEESYNEYIEWRDLHDQPKLERQDFDSNEEYEEYLDKRWEVDEETWRDLTTPVALVSKGILFGWRIYAWILDRVPTGESVRCEVHAAELFEHIVNTEPKEREQWMDELAYFLWTAVDHYPQLDVEGHPIKMTSVGEDLMYHKKCLQQIACFVNWWEGTQKKRQVALN